MGQQFADAARTNLAGAISSGDTSFPLGDGSLFPDASTGAAAPGDGNTWFKAVVADADGFEIVVVRTHALSTTPNAVSNVIRGQDGTTARAFGTDAIFAIRPLAADMDTAINARQPREAGKGLSTDDFVDAPSDGTAYARKDAAWVAAATAAQGAKADTALQPADIGVTVASLAALNGRRALTGSGAPVGTDLNDPNFRVAGDYQLGGGSYTNTPPGVTAEWHLLLVFRVDNTCVQLLLAPSNAGGKGYMRTGDYLNSPEAGWSAWRDFSLPDMATQEQMQDGVSTAAAGMSPKLVADAIAARTSALVPTTRTVNGKALTDNIGLNAADVGALPANGLLVPAGTANTLNLAAANKAVPITANTTIPTHASVAYDTGTCIVLECGGTARTITGPASNSLTIDGKSGTVTSFTLKADTSVAIRKTGTNTWRVYGDV